jgi:hypothetical protein
MATGLSLLLFFLLLFLLSLGIWVAPALITLGLYLIRIFYAGSRRVVASKYALGC